jgi:integrase
MRSVFTGADGGLHRRSNFRPRVWLPALAGDTDVGWSPVQPGTHFHDLRHSHKTWLLEDGVPRVLQRQRLGHKPQDVSDRYSHITEKMVDSMVAGLEQRWEQDCA